MGIRIKTYVDTSAFIAFLDRSDTHHALFRRLFSHASELITTTLVIAEGHGWFLRRYDRTRALQFLAMIEDMKPLTVLPIGAAELAGATKLLRKFSDQNLTLTDAAGLYLMQAQRIKHCWSSDFHLGLTGATLATDGE
jgi:predicted nucleic acid-binding protein